MSSQEEWVEIVRELDRQKLIDRMMRRSRNRSFLGGREQVRRRCGAGTKLGLRRACQGENQQAACESEADKDAHPSQLPARAVHSDR